jgi:hypothetical protein
MVTYCSTNTKCARLNVHELPRTDIQGLAATFPSHPIAARRLESEAGEGLGPGSRRRARSRAERPRRQSDHRQERAERHKLGEIT